MPTSPRVGNADLVSMEILVDGNTIRDVYQVADVQISKEINRIPVAKVMILDGSAVEENFEISESTDFLPGKRIEIKAGYHGKNATVFKGVIVKHGIRVRNNKSSFLVITCNDAAVKMTVARSSEQYTKKKDSDVIRDLVHKAGLKSDVKATAVQHEQQIKHYASDWDYIVTRAEVNGQVVIVDDGKVVVESPEYREPELVIRYGDTLAEIDAEIDARSQLEKVRARAWDPAKQELVSGDSKEPTVNRQGNLAGRKLADVLRLDAFELQGSGPSTKPELDSWANAQMLKSRLARIRGSVTFPGSAKAKPGTLIRLDGVGKRFNGDAYVSSVRHNIEAGEWTTRVSFGLARRWFTETQEGIEAPPAAGTRPAVQGLQIGVVKQIHEDPEDGYRIRVALPMVEFGGDGIWVRLVSGYATSDAGIFFFPEIGDEVVLGFLNDDPVSAIVLGSLYSGKRKAPYEPDQKNTVKAVVTNSKLKISFDDEKKVLVIETPGGQQMTLSDDEKSITLKDCHKNEIEMKAGGISLSSPSDISISADGKVNIQAEQDVTIKGMNTNVEANVKLSAKGTASAELTASGDLTVKGGVVMIN